MKFEIGDRVRVAKPQGGMESLLGLEGTVVEIQPSYFVWPVRVRLDGDEGAGGFHPKELELVEDASGT